MSEWRNRPFFFLKKISWKQLKNQEENKIFLTTKHSKLGKKKKAHKETTIGDSPILGNNFCFLSEKKPLIQWMK